VRDLIQGPFELELGNDTAMFTQKGVQCHLGNQAITPVTRVYICVLIISAPMAAAWNGMC